MNEESFTTALINFRRDLHRHPEISEEESATAARVKKFINDFEPDRIAEGVGGHGLIAEFSSGREGPSLMFRCELDALPIREKNDITYASAIPGKGHLCGHDGHMAMVAGLGRHLMNNPPTRGRVMLLFQPSEENGKGAEAVLNDPLFKDFEPDHIFALHNLPGYPLHHVVVSKDHFAAASSGMRISLEGRSSHAAEPEKGINPGFGMAGMIMAFRDVMKIERYFRDFVLITPIHARLGKVAYGTSPGEGVIHLTLRSYRNDDMSLLKKELEGLVMTIAEREKLSFEMIYEEVFPATINDAACSGLIETAAANLKLGIETIAQPFRWSEDFGHFTAKFPGAIFGLGSGESQPALHNPDYDFPDALIPTGIKLYQEIYRQIIQ